MADTAALKIPAWYPEGKARVHIYTTVEVVSAIQDLAKREQRKPSRMATLLVEEALRGRGLLTGQEQAG